MKQYWVKYKLETEDREIGRLDAIFRNELLGPNHWNGMSYTGHDVEVTVVVNEEQAFLLSLKYLTKVKEYVALPS